MYCFISIIFGVCAFISCIDMLVNDAQMTTNDIFLFLVVGITMLNYKDSK